MHDALVDLTADCANRSVDVLEAVLVGAEQVQREPLRREQLDRELDGAKGCARGRS